MFYAAIRVNERPLYFDFDRGYIITVSSNPSSDWFNIRTRKTQHAGYGYLRGVYIFCITLATAINRLVAVTSATHSGKEIAI